MGTAACRRGLEERLRSQGAFEAVADAMERPQLAIPLLPSAVGGGEVGHTVLWHFMMHHTTLGQVRSAPFS